MEGKNSCLYPLSNSQWNIWHLEQSFPGTPVNNICETIRIRGVFDVVLLQKALNLIVQADPSLRTQIVLGEDHLPLQTEREYAEQQFPVFDFSTTNQTGIQHWEKSITREVMPVLDAPLFYFAILKINEHEGAVFVKTHHLISDGWSQVSLINRIAETYLALLDGEDVRLEPAPSYRLHVEEEQRYLASKAFERDRAYWEEILRDVPAPVSLKESANAQLSPVGQRVSFTLSDTLNHALNAFCTEHRIAPFAVFYMVLAIYLKRVRKTGRLCIGAPVHNRSSRTDRLSTGMFVSTLPFFSELDESWSFEEFSTRLAEDWLELLRHQRFPFSRIQELARQQSEHGRLFHLVLSFHNSRAYQNRDTSIAFSGQWHYAGYQAEQLCIHLNNIEDERRYSVNYDYLTQLFSRHEIEALHHYLVNLLTQALSLPERPIYALSLLGPEEQEAVLYTFNRTDTFCYQGNLSQRLSEVCAAQPAKIAVIEAGQRLSYQALWAQGGAVARQIFQFIPKGREIAAILLPKSTPLFTAMTGVIRSGCAFLLLSPELPAQRLRQILSGSGARVLLSTPELAASCGASLPLINMEQLPEEAPAPIPDSPAAPEDLAYLVYTSGSTGAPKGVEIEQRSLLNFAAAMQPVYGRGAVLSLCNIGFDAFLLESAAALLNGQTIVLPSAQEQENPAALAGLIRSYGVGFLALTPSRLGAYLKEERFFRAAGRLEAIVCGGEHFPGSLLKALTRCTGARIYNQYGPSETTVGVSIALLNHAPLITAGAPMPNCRCYVLDKHLQPLPTGVYGDLYIGGLCVGRGYHNAPELTASAFLPSPFEPGERLYRTGDLAAWTPQGELLLQGREDGQIKLRGQRIELEEIASCLMLHPAIREAIVRLRELNGQELLVAYYVAQQPLSEAELLEFSATYLPSYMVPSVFQPVGSIPLTANGKVDDARLPLPKLRRMSPGASLSPAAETILEVFRRVLGRPGITAEDDYFLCGGDSLNAMETLSELEQAFGIRLRVADLAACRSAQRLAARLGASDNGTPADTAVIAKAPVQESYPLTPAQLGIYFETQLSPEAASYNMPCGFCCAGRIDPLRLERALQQLVAEQPVFRTAFLPYPGGIRQKVLDTAPTALETYEGCSLDEAKAAFVRPFDLSAPPLLRLALWQEDSRSVVLLDMHHIISDGMTAALTLQRLDALYRGAAPQTPALAYPDYACWLSPRQASLTESEHAYWAEALRDAPAPLELPTDFPRGKRFDYRGGVLEFSLTEADSLACSQYCDRTGITPYMLFAGAFGLLLFKLSGCRDLLAGTPVSCRRSPELSGMFGLFVNTLPLRFSFPEGETLAAYFQKTRDRIVGLLDHPDTPLEELISLSGTGRDQGNSPLYRALVSMRPMELDGASFDGMPVQNEPVPSGSAKLDLNLEVFREHGCYCFRLEYAASLFAPDTIALYSRSLTAILHQVLAEDSVTVDDCNATAPIDRYRLWERPNSLRMPYSDLPIDRQVDAMADLIPDEPALIFHGQAMTFRELKQRSDHLAAVLAGRGVRPGDAVGLLCRRSPELVVGMMAVLKTGAAYVPMLPSFPEKRLRYMAEISGASLILCDPATFRTPPQGLERTLLEIDSSTGQSAGFVPPQGRSGDDTCFILFTSGSTGQPKGVMIRHRSICNMMAVLEPTHAAVEGGYLCTANSIFDIFVTETLVAMAYGKYSVMADEEEMMLPWKLAELIRRHHVGLIEFTPSRAQLFVHNQAFFEAIRQMPIAMMCGEVLPPQLLERLREAGCRRIFNLYGPTEVTVYCTMDDVTSTDRITVGRMYPNCRGYVLDEAQRPVMPTACGELYFAGECLSAGYVGREDLTREAFLPDPFFPGETMYRSGDLVRLLPDGRIDFIGRRDHQIKLNGQRIELAEITQKIIDSGMVAQAATVVRRDGGFMKLFAFLEPRPGEQVNLPALRQYLGEELPPYMVPSELHLLPALPCTASGKVDLKALETIDLSAPEQAPAAAEPVRHHETEAPSAPPQKAAEPISELVSEPAPAAEARPALTAGRLEALWKETLSREEIDPDRSFFEQGGTSLAALSLLSSYYNEGVSLSLAEFYDHPTLNSQLTLLQLETAAPVCPPAEPAEPARIPQAPAEPISELVSEPGPAAEARPALTAGRLEALWKETLSREEIDPDRSFFEQGGTSLAALSLLSSYYNEGVSLSLAEFYDHPTLNSQLAFLGLASEEPDPAPKSDPVPQASGRAQPEKQGVLLTGATGFFGAHLVRELLESGCPRVFCLVRGDAPARLEQVLSWYFGAGWFVSVRSRIVPVSGDILKPGFGLAPGQASIIQNGISLLIHAAADVRHYASDGSAERTNIEGTANAIRVAAEAGARLCMISTVSLGAEYLPNAPQTVRSFSEQDFEIGQNWRENVYLRGKFEAERLVRQAAASGLDALILRVGRLVGRSSDGVFQINAASNALYGLVQGLSCLSVIDRELAQLPLELTAVDECARAAVLLLQAPGPVYHLFNPHLMTIRDILKALGRPMPEVDSAAFEAKMQERSRQGCGTLLAPLMSQYHRLKQVPFRITPVCGDTENTLSQRGFTWGDPCPERTLLAFF